MAWDPETCARTVTNLDRRWRRNGVYGKFGRPTLPRRRRYHAVAEHVEELVVALRHSKAEAMSVLRLLLRNPKVDREVRQAIRTVVEKRK